MRYLLICLLICFAPQSLGRPNHKLKIGIVSLYDKNYKHIGIYSDLNKKKYAAKHKYNLILYHKTLDKMRPTAWSKIRALQLHLNHYDWLMWTDADSLIMNSNIKLESLIDPTYDLIISCQADGTINTGSFIIKNSNWSRALLKKIYDQTECIHHPWWEQQALIYLLDNYHELYDHIKIVPQRTMNSHPFHAGGEYKTGDFIIHMYNGPNMNKQKLMKEYYAISLLNWNS